MICKNKVYLYDVPNYCSFNTQTKKKSAESAWSLCKNKIYLKLNLAWITEDRAEPTQPSESTQWEIAEALKEADKKQK